MNGQQLTAKQELQVRRSAAAHLSGLPARHNAIRISELETEVLLEEVQSRATPEEWARWGRNEESLGLSI